ncbi:uncharacterized protein LOC120778216 [Bactrocera tryoni]|uniref:uncharacterized protein LOC120778216 n=1 Tax=Bactrocera tryoni TaxID=59916 RepID=UPI001A9988ED|nr:uncharacterized protein LOC120778216 [Bactrocera tryoni]
MLKANTSRETAHQAEAQAPNSCNENNNNSVPLGKEVEEDNMQRRSSNRKYNRHDAGHYADNMSGDESDESTDRRMTTTRKSRKIQPTDAHDYDGGVSDCSHCRKHRMARARRNRRRKSRSRSRRRRR